MTKTIDFPFDFNQELWFVEEYYGKPYFRPAKSKDWSYSIDGVCLSITRFDVDLVNTYSLIDNGPSVFQEVFDNYKECKAQCDKLNAKGKHSLSFSEV